MERKVDGYRRSPPKCPQASAIAPIRLVRMERKVDGYRRPPLLPEARIRELPLVSLARKVVCQFV
jgi:hypothetical protein